jgi:hypothetical protein
MLVVVIPENNKPVVLVGLGYKGLERNRTKQGEESRRSHFLHPRNSFRVVSTLKESLLFININLCNCSCKCIFIVFIVCSVSFVVCVVLRVVSYCSTTAIG